MKFAPVYVISVVSTLSITNSFSKFVFVLTLYAYACYRHIHTNIISIVVIDGNAKPSTC